jgi:NADH dehydrogenase
VITADVLYFEPWWMQIAKAIVIFAVGLQIVPIALMADRKVMGRMQNRYGPNRVGPFGALTPIADIGKLLFKQQFRPRTSIGWMFAMAPLISIVAAVGALAIVPTSSGPRPGSTASTPRSARSTCSPSAPSPSTGSCSAAGRRAPSTRSWAPCAPPRS